MLNRRSLLTATALAVPLGGCAWLQGASANISTIAKYAQAAANVAEAVIGYFPAGTLTDAIKADLGLVVTNANQVIATAPVTTASTAWQQKLYDAIKVVLPVVAPFVSTVPGVSIGIAAFQALMPYIAAGLGLTAMKSAAPTVSVPGVTPMSIDDVMKQFGPK